MTNPAGARRLCAGLFTLFLLAGCTHTLHVQGEFPSPLVEKLPHTAGVHYPEEFLEYQYQEDSEDRSKWIIEMGQAQAGMFRAVLPGIFQETRELPTPPGDSPGGERVDLIVVPTMAEFQYTLPRETKLKVYEVWLKYNIQVFEPDGSLVADWVLTAYGKTPSGFMQSDEAALNQAVVVALRDAGANLSLNFAKVPEVEAWLAER